MFPAHPLFGFVFTLCALAAVAPVARGEVQFTSSERSDGSPLNVVRMTVTPAAEPEPVFRYRLVARDIDIMSGNAAPFYYRALMIASNKSSTLAKKYGDAFDEWSRPTTGTDSTPLAELPLERVREAVELSTGGQIGEQLAFATTRRHCDWEIGLEEIRGPALFAVPLEEFQQSRQLSRWINLRTRLAIAEHRYDDAVDTMRTNYRLAQDFASAPFLVAGLIGIAEAGLTSGTVTELIAAPDSPNLYWALSELPQPLIDMRPAVRFEIDFGPRLFPFLYQAATTDRSPQEWNRLYTQTARELASLGEVEGFPDLNNLGGGIGATAMALVGYPHAKAALIESGIERDRVEQMAVGQVMAIYSERIYPRHADRFERLWYMPYWEVDRFATNLETDLKAARPMLGSADREVLPIVTFLLPAMQAARTAQVRLERDIAALRVIEALRMYAANSGGLLPQSLDAISQVPVPLDPVTGKPFEYRLDGQQATLDLLWPVRNSAYNRRYEIEVADTDQAK